MEFEKGTKVIFNDSTEESPVWVERIIDGNETQELLNSVSFIEVDGKGNDIIIG